MGPGAGGLFGVWGLFRDLGILRVALSCFGFCTFFYIGFERFMVPGLRVEDKMRFKGTVGLGLRVHGSGSVVDFHV